MTRPKPQQLARHIDGMRRRTTPRRPGVVIREIPGGWLSARPNADPGQFPSSSVNRVYWVDRDAKLSAGEIAAALEAARPLGISRLYGWLAPWAWDERVEEDLCASGATRWPHLEYVALSREASAMEPARASAITTRVLRADELEALLAPAAAWYSEEGIASAKRLAADGISEIHAGFDGPDLVALGTLTLEGEGAYLGAAGTRPDARGRGAQTALIAARVSRAAALGVRWCCAETNTAVPISLRNLERAGFERRINWRVYWWDGPALARPVTGATP
jgi:GNAT superfamily N-acetyltransferase